MRLQLDLMSNQTAFRSLAWLAAVAVWSGAGCERSAGTEPAATVPAAAPAAETAAAPAPPAPAGPPRIAFAETRHDFGRIDQTSHEKTP